MRHAYSQATQREQVQGLDEGESVNVYVGTKPPLHPVICWWGHWCLIGENWRHHRLISWARELASSRISLPYLVGLGNALLDMYKRKILLSFVVLGSLLASLALAFNMFGNGI
jgi:hypothetical protein